MTENQCPYNDGVCPRVKEIMENNKSIEKKIDFLFCVIIALHGTEIAGLLSLLN